MLFNELHVRRWRSARTDNYDLFDRCLRNRIACEKPRAEESTAPQQLSVCHMMPSLLSSSEFGLCQARFGPKKIDRRKAMAVL